MERKEYRTTIIALAKDCINKSAFIFNSSVGLPTPTNKYKKLLEFFEVTINDVNEMISINGEYVCGEFSYFVYEELSYSNYNREDQKLINPVKKKYIDLYDDNEFPLYNLSLNDNAKANLTERHSGNINQIYKDLHYKKLKDFYDQLTQLENYDLVTSYLSDEKRKIDENIPISEISRKYFAGDKDAGIEILLRKRKIELDKALSNCEQVKSLRFNFEILLNAYKLAMEHPMETTIDYATRLLSLHLKTEWSVEKVLSLIVNLSKDKIRKYIEEKNDIQLWIDMLNSDYYWFRDNIVEDLMGAYIEEKDKNKKICLILAIYEKQTNHTF